MAVVDPDSAVDVIYVPASADTENPRFELSLFEDVGAAEDQAEALRSAATVTGHVEQHQNVVLIVSRDLPEPRRDSVTRALDALAAENGSPGP